MSNIFPSIHPLVAHKLSLLRDKNTEHKKFRELIREISTLLTYEATSDVILYQISIDTPLATTTGKVLSEKICLVPILRAGLGMVGGVWHMMPSAEVWHIGLYRDENSLKPVEYYKKVPAEPDVSVCLILDPMLATGGSAAAAVDILKRWGAQRIQFVGLIAAPEGLARPNEAPPDVDVHLAAVDDHLTPEPTSPHEPPAGYIVPGLGDAG